MNLDDDAVAHFREGRAALVRKRDELNRAIESVDHILTDLLGPDDQPPVVRPVQSQRASTSAAGGADSVVLAAIRPYGQSKEWSPAQIHALLESNGVTWGYATTRSTVSRMGREGILMKLRRGAYRLPAENTSTPALTGVDVEQDLDTVGGETKPHEEATLHDHHNDPPGRDGRGVDRPVVVS